MSEWERGSKDCVGKEIIMSDYGRRNDAISASATTVKAIKITSEPYDSRLPGKTIYADWTSGTNYHFYLSNGETYGIGTRYFNGFYTETCPIPENDTGEEIRISDVDIRIRAKMHNKICDALTDSEKEQIKKEISSISDSDSDSDSDKNKKVLVKKQALLSIRGFRFSEEEMGSIINPDKYYSEKMSNVSLEDIKNTPPGTVFKYFHGFTWWNTLSDIWEFFIPWSETTWGSKEQMEKEKAFEKEAEEASKGHEKEYFKLAKQFGIPYSLVVKCWGDTEMFKNIMPNLRAIVNFSVHVEKLKLSKFETRNKELIRLGFTLEERYQLPIAEYLLKCIRAQKIVYRD